jgi:methylated-DNA-protein-cysteine methyltransferase-like protein
MLTGKMHFKTAIEMQSLLESEHTSVANDRIAEFKSKFWDPMVELTID